jgi:hypothetical protein
MAEALSRVVPNTNGGVILSIRHVQANGTPLSERIARGSPRSLNKRSKAVNAGSSRLDSRASHSNRYREAWSVVSGKQ